MILGLAVLLGIFADQRMLSAQSVASDKTAESTPSLKSLFDGKTLDGWEGDPKWFKVREGVIVAGSDTESIPHNYFLCTEKTYGDFELIVEARLVGKGDNAGVQFRTKRIPNDTEVIGYQADIGFFKDGTCWGALYDESRRRKFLAEDQEKAQKAVKRGEWNELRVLAKGDRIQIFLNGVQTVDYTEQDPEIERDGVIALQVHSGPQLEAQYRNVRLREL
ncbi:DUF1080 domain-containing protein [Stieleria sp. JC731]|uniref:3-keto-disaccharide hydrolase n=1 Tax=Pirellulaceae TaxID=2691357 RepID=UPI001E2BE07B|nr:DUF1080 domain-containing protein [Stieleria sp. JC731]MCC9601757.1 DUF1080 domain-containing protein [Stieleria sp. JC731]